MTEKAEIFYKCKHCPCCFLTKEDLEAHLRVFGDRPHLNVWKELHWRVDHAEI